MQQNWNSSCTKKLPTVARREKLIGEFEVCVEVFLVKTRDCSIFGVFQRELLTLVFAALLGWENGGTRGVTEMALLNPANIFSLLANPLDHPMPVCTQVSISKI